MNREARAPHPLPRPRARIVASALLAALLGMLVFASGASADAFTPESGGSPNADEIDSLYKFILAIAVVVFVGVEGALIYSLVKFRRRKGNVDAAQIRGNTNLEIGWTVGAAVILVLITVITFIKLPDIREPERTGADSLTAGGVLVASTDQPDPPGGKSLEIDVNGQQYLWRYTYPNGVFSYEQMVVPVNTTVTLNIRAQDVAHSWWIPKLGGKMDALPGGYVNETWFKIPASKAGQSFKGQCAELCGRGHANMLGTVRAVSVAEYQSWLKQQEADIKEANEYAARENARRAGETAEAEESSGSEAEGQPTADEAETSE